MSKRIVLCLVLFSGVSELAFAADVEWQALPQTAPAPADSPTTSEKVELGKMLFFDTRFSSTGNVSCFSCHNVMEGGDDHRPTSIGVLGQVGGRNAPTVWNAAFNSAQFWDGRAATLEDQAKGPPGNPVEMGMKDLNAVITRIRKISGYQPYFEAFSGKGGSSPSTMPPSGQGVMMKFPLIAGTTYETKHKLTYTAPYFHNGPVKRLDEALRVMGKTRLNKELADTEVADMVAFPSALDDRFLQQTMPRLPPTPGDLLTEN